MSNNSTILKVIADKEFQELLIEKMKADLLSLPKGSLCQKIINGKKYSYHYTCEKPKRHDAVYTQKQAYISKENGALRQALQKKEFLKKSLKILEKNIAASEHFLSKYEDFNPAGIVAALPKAYSDFAPENSVENPEDTKKINVTEWKNATLAANKIHPENLTHTTSKGLKVRSKSESIISTLLDMNDIPYRYEYPLRVGERTFHPDFTVVNPFTQKIFYWEHFGMMDDPKYRNKTRKKLSSYINSGITPWDKLIMTFESNEDMFDAEYINKIIKILLL